MAIRIDFLANVTDLVKGTGAVDTALDRVSSSLDDVVRDGQQGTHRLEQSFRELAESSKRIDPGSSIGRSVKHGTQEADEGVRTFKENTKSNLKEVAASFDGTAQGVSDGFQGLIAEVAEGFGPVGLIAGALAAGAIGIISTQLQGAQADSDEFKAHVADLADQLIETGGDGTRSISDIRDELKGLATESDTNKISLQGVRDIAEQLHIPFKRAAEAVAEGGDAAQVALDQTKRLLDVEKDRMRVYAGARLTFDQTQLQALQKQYDSLLKVREATKKAQQQQKDYVDAGGPALERAAQATDDYAEGVQSALADAGSAFEKYTHKGKVNLQEYNKALEDEQKAITDYQKNVVSASRTLSQDALNYIESLGPKAAPLLKAYVDAPNALKERTAANWDELGRTAGTAYTAQLKDHIPTSVRGPKVLIGFEYAQSARDAYSELDRYFRARPLSVTVDAHTRNGQRAG